MTDDDNAPIQYRRNAYRPAHPLWLHLRSNVPFVSAFALLVGLAIPGSNLTSYPVRLTYGLIMLAVVIRVLIYVAPRRWLK